MGIQQSRPPSFYPIYLGVPHTSVCSHFAHSCALPDESSGEAATLPRLHRLSYCPEVHHYPHLHIYHHGLVVWVDGWGRVKLVERNLGVREARYFICVGRWGVVRGWIRVPMSATCGAGRGVVGMGGRPIRRCLPRPAT